MPVYRYVPTMQHIGMIKYLGLPDSSGSFCWFFVGLFNFLKVKLRVDHNFGIIGWTYRALF